MREEELSYHQTYKERGGHPYQEKAWIQKYQGSVFQVPWQSSL